MSDEKRLEKIVSLAKRRGFIFLSSEIYGGAGGVWDYGPLGVEMKRNIKDSWWNAIVRTRSDVEGLDAGIIMSPQVWVASGHVDSFTDPMVDCRECKKRFRADQIEGDKCPECGGELTEARQFNLMFKTHIGPIEEEASTAYLRPETAQGIFVNFKNVQVASRQKVPFGIAQIGKAFRNEINPRNFTFRSREFEQMELEFFIPPGENDQWFDYWVRQRMDWYKSIGLASDRLRFRPHEQKELAHYARKCVDVEYLFPFGWSELEGIADRGDFDLRMHAEHSKKDMKYFDETKNEHYLPHVIEASAGVDRTLLTLLVDAYDEEEVKGETRVMLRLHPDISPIQVGVFPLSKKPQLAEVAWPLAEKLGLQGFRAFYDEAGSIGKRYRRQDEVGTPLGITVDFDSLEDKAATIRFRDSMRQDRVPIEDIPGAIREALDKMRLEKE